MIGDYNDENVPRYIHQALAGEPVHTERDAVLNGQQFWLEIDIVPDVRADGETDGVFILMTDVTERKKTETALRQSEELSRRVFESAPIGISLVGPGMRLLRVNKTMCRMVGYSEKELLAVGISNVIHPEEVESGMNRGKLLRAGEIPPYQTERRYLRKDGTVVWANVTAAVAKNEDDSSMFTIIGMTEDITARKEAEQTVRESAERFRGIFENSPFGISLVGSDRRILEVNPALCRMLGYSRSELLALPASYWTHPDDDRKYQEENKEFLKGQSPMLRTERHYIHRSGATVVTNNTASLVRRENGEPLYAVVILEDITEIKKAEATLRESEQLAATGRLAAGVAHEINNPLAGIHH